MGEEVGGLKAGREHQNVERVLDPLAVNDPGRGHSGYRPGHELHVVAQQGRIEIVRENDAFAVERVLRAQPLGEIGSACEDLVDVAERLVAVLGVQSRAGNGNAVSPHLRRRQETPHAFQPVAEPSTQLAALSAGEIAHPLGHHVSGLALEDVELAHLRCDLRDNLGRGAAGADNAHSLAGEIVLRLPSGGVEHGSSKAIETRPLRIVDGVQQTNRTDHDLGAHHVAITGNQSITVGFLVPDDFLDLHVEAKVSLQIVLFDDVVHVAE